MGHKIRALSHSDIWRTPPYFYNVLNREFDFDFDPCPYNESDLELDGLAVDWGQRNFVNPPYSQQLKEQFVIKAIQESNKGKICVMLLPVSTSSKLFHEYIAPNASEIRFVRGRIYFYRHIRGAGMHDSMLVVFDGSKTRNGVIYSLMEQSDDVQLILE